jgi:AraC-like DNA-binding protein
VELLALPDSRIEDVAARLGYADGASFRKAFIRWYGVPPAIFRETL